MQFSKQSILVVALSVFSGSIAAGPLHEAIKAGDAAKVEVLLAIGAVKVDELDSRGIAPLHYAVIAGMPIVELLTNAGANVKRWTEFRIKSYTNFTPSHIAVFHNKPKIIELLTKKGADLNAIGPSGGLPVLQMLKVYGTGEGQLIPPYHEVPFFTISKGMATLLLKHGAKTEVEGHSPLHNKNISMDMVKFFLTNNADPSVQRSTDGKTPLHVHVLWRNKDVVKLLFGAGAKADVQDASGKTLFHALTASKSLGRVDGFFPERKIKNWFKLLMGKGLDINRSDNEGFTPLHSAAGGEDGNFELKVLLGTKGIKLSPVAKKGATPLHTAAKKDNIGNVHLLIDAGLDVNAMDADGWGPLVSGTLQRSIYPKYDQTLRGSTRQQMNVAKALLQAGADPFALAHNGNSPFHLAAEEVIYPLLELFLSSPAFIKNPSRINIKNGKGETSLDILVERGIGGDYDKQEVVTWLEGHGAKRSAELGKVAFAKRRRRRMRS